jgi:peptidoglycan/xylan/chitin deacetylase (PgdA/CDA1 family)
MLICGIRTTTIPVENARGLMRAPGPTPPDSSSQAIAAAQFLLILKALFLACMISTTDCRAAAAEGSSAMMEVRRGPVASKRMALVFTGHEHAESGEAILDQVARHKIHASFFLTGDFLAQTNYARLIQRIVGEGHYLGAHSDKHLLYCTWDAKRASLVTREAFRKDLQANLAKIAAFDTKASQGKIFLPPYEHANEDIARWTVEMGLVLVNYTPGTRSPADYTGEAEKNFVSSQAILESIVQREGQDTNGLNGFILLLHLGAGPGRQDKFVAKFGELLDFLKTKGYEPVRIDDLLGAKGATK